MHILRTYKLFIYIILAFSFPGCDAPRNNPFDPENEDGPFVVLDGHISSKLTSEALSEVKLTFLPYSISAYTNKDGLFAFDYFEKMDGWLKLEKAGYFSDSIFVEWGSNKKKSVNFAIGNKPKLTNFIYYSSVQNRYNLQSIDNILIKTKVTELGNTIDSVFLRLSGEYIKSLDFNVSNKFFETNLSAGDMNFNSIDELIGKQLELVIMNSMGKEALAGIINIQRVIRSEIEPESPFADENVSLPINFKWKKFTPGFPFSYLLQIYTNEIEPQLVAQKAFSGSNENYEFGSYINPGKYFWVIWCIDEFGNRNRSKPLSFSLQ